MKSLRTPINRTRRRGLPRVLTVSLALALALAGCSSGSSSDDTASATTGGTLTVGVSTDVGKFDPIFSNLPTYDQFAYATLVYKTPEGEYGPNLASEWEFAADNTSISLTLRSDAKFSDGTAVTAQAVADSMNRFIQTPSAKQLQVKSFKTATATGDDTVELSFTGPLPQDYALRYLSQDSAFAMITAPAATADPDSINAATNGAGPYMLDPEQSTSGTQYTFVANPNYFAPEARTYDTIVIKPFADPSALANAVTTGQVTYAVSVPASAVGAAQSAGLQLSKGALGIGDSGTAMVVFGNQESGPAADPKVRQAIAMAIPRDDINKALYADLATPTSSATPEGVPGYTGDDPYPYDVDKAKQLLAEAGYPDGFELTITDLGAFDPGFLIGQAVQGALADVGIKVTIEKNNDPFTDLVPKLLNGTGFDTYIYVEQGEDIYSYVTGSLTGVSTVNPRGRALPAAVTDALNAAVSAPADQQGDLLKKVTQAVDEMEWSATVLSIPRLTVVAAGVKNVPATYVTAEPSPVSPNKGESWYGNGS